MKVSIYYFRFAHHLRFTGSGLALLAMCMFLMSCERSDSRLRQQAVGTWGKQEGEITFDSLGIFHSRWGSNKPVDFFGTWEVKNGILMATSTNIDSHGFTNMPPVGQVDSFRIIQVDASRLVLEIDGHTNSYIRK